MPVLFSHLSRAYQFSFLNILVFFFAPLSRSAPKKLTGLHSRFGLELAGLLFQGDYEIAGLEYSLLIFRHSQCLPVDCSVCRCACGTEMTAPPGGFNPASGFKMMKWMLIGVTRDLGFSDMRNARFSC